MQAISLSCSRFQTSQEDWIKGFGDKGKAILFKEREQVVRVYWVPINAQDRFYAIVRKSRLSEYTQVTPLRDFLAKVLVVVGTV